MQTRGSIHILAVLSESYIQKKSSDVGIAQIYTEFRIFLFLPVSKL